MVFALLCAFAACKNNDKEKEEKNTSQETSRFKLGELPYQLSDTGLQKNTDTTSLSSAMVTNLIPDSIKNGFFGKQAKIKYTPLIQFSQKKENYYVIKASSGAKKAAFLAISDQDNRLLASYPFLLPDADPNTSQTSAIDKNFTVTKSITQRNGADASAEGKEVVAYDAAEKKFSLILLDPLNETTSEAVSPIDTFPKTNKLAGDYWMNKKNLVSIRDGRYNNQLMVYIHTENADGDCKGELRGEFLMTSSTTATYRQGGDPCVLTLTFKGANVSMNEEKGCGNYRGLDCPLTGTFTKKKAQSVKPNSIKPKRK
ncbi:MAG: hypothetical protein EOO53_22050 [Gammaproteobacteria bacterium]|nr:MAG: hypothetical protein EOO53_22050 [Gammaproteobacteria bacterium]